MAGTKATRLGMIMLFQVENAYDSPERLLRSIVFVWYGKQCCDN